MALDDLIGSLEREAEAELARHRAAQAARAERIRSDAEATADALVADAVAQAETAAHRDAALEAADARATAAAAVRDAREEALDTVLNAARARLAGGTVRLLDGALAQLLDEALAVLPAPQRVHVAARDERAAADALRRAGVQAQVVADLPTAGGVVLHGAGRRVDNTFEARLAAAWPRERSRLARSWDAGTTTDAGTATTGAAGAGSADP